jgi:adhesin/invasin
MITATSDSRVATTTVTFEPDLPYTLTLVAYPTDLTVVDTSTLSATVKDQYGNLVGPTVVTFTTSLGEVGSESVTKTTTSGVAIAELSSQVPGTATVTATADPVSDTVDVTFEVGPPYTVTLVAYPTSLTVGAISTLTVTVSDQFNNNVADGTVVNFETNLGSLGSATVSKTTVSGVATATLTSQVAGTAVVTATSDSKYGTANVTFNPDLPYTMTVEAYPTSIPIGGFTSEITVTVKDQYDNPVADGTEVTLITDLGSIGSNSVVKTTVNGVANATLTSGLIIGTANITATSGSTEGQTQVIFTVGAPETVAVESWPPTIEVGGSTATITATVTDIGGYPVADGTPVVFTTDFASLGSSTVTKYTTDGVAVATLTSGTTPGVARLTPRPLKSRPGRPLA